MHGQPDIAFKPLQVDLKPASKIHFMQREDIERIILKNLSMIPNKLELALDMTTLVEMTRDTDINYTKQKFTEIYGKLIVPESMIEIGGAEEKK